MRKYLLAAVAVAAVAATPAMARDNSLYVGLEGGITKPKTVDIRGSVNFTDPLVPDIADGRVASVRHKWGYDVDALLGYDFGMFRLEGELGYKHSKLKDIRFNDAFLNAIGTGAGGTFVDSDFDLNGKTTVLSGMANALLDFGSDAGFGGYVGGGFGRARVKTLGDSDSAWAWQLIAGVRTAVSSNVDVGLKYRYFRTGKLNFNDEAAFPVGTTCTTAACSGGVAFFDADDHYSSHSLMLSLIYNFAAAAPAAPPPPPPPPPPPAAPATQTCPDGSVIDATATCPVPPPPPPPPPPVERGERGK